mmetsp:Transcript_11484/g.15813  ORF Transcript_11484/g.15813 Transcript_11484/m.15813 type:complete len:180 (+) Transcript_11484:128-667(+)
MINAVDGSKTTHATNAQDNNESVAIAAVGKGISFCRIHPGMWTTKPGNIYGITVRDCPICKEEKTTIVDATIVFDNTPEPSAKSPSRIQLVLVEGGENYADCDGWYVHQGNYLNDRQVFVCEKKSRFIGWNGSTWTLTGMQWHDDFVKKEERNFGGFHANINGNCSIEKSQWKNYIVQF